MSKPSDVRVRETALYFLPVRTRVPLKFGAQVLNQVVCARVHAVVEDRQGRIADGWGETPLSVAWVWPSILPWEDREDRMKEFCVRLAKAVIEFGAFGHPLALGDAFQQGKLDALLREANEGQAEPMPHLAALVCHSLFDLAIYDAFARLLDRPVFAALDREFLSASLTDSFDGDLSFVDRWPADYLIPREDRLPVWHLVGGLDPLDLTDLTGTEPQDGYPLTLRQWIREDGLKCLKIKLRGDNAEWDYERLVRVGSLAIEERCEYLTADFNCTVTDPAYVCDILDRLEQEEPRIHALILYIEQPFPYDLEAHRIDVQEVSRRKPLFLDESAHDWRHVRLGRELGWTGVALKTCKTLTGALLSLCWARANGMSIMVQDLTNPMLAQIPHLLLAAHAGTILGVESNAMQFYPEASAPEREVHPGIYRRRHGLLNLSTLGPTGFGYRVDEIARELPEPLRF
ncbi:MAG TPA: enolase C-terminal domain-like protein [Chthoniobacteraceae bacterium]|nr:enolase C-terminal domain-like protein [Chthoniobacteraceae bacterium]